jgi:hypothetical protein
VSLSILTLHLSPLTQHACRLTTITSTVDATSWSIGTDFELTPYAAAKTLTITSAVSQTVDVPLANARRGIEPRKADVIGVWMKHPWSHNPICYECYTKKPSQFSWVKCNAGPKIGDICGARPVGPDGSALTTTTTYTTTTTTSTSTTEMFPGTWTVTSTTTLPATVPLPIEPRSWHRKVSFKLPWNDIRACADAEWEKRGTPNFEIRLQEVHMDDGNDCKDAPSLDLPEVIVETDTVTNTQTKTISDFAMAFTATVTATVYTSVYSSVIVSTPPPPPLFSPSIIVSSVLSPTVTTVSTDVMVATSSTTWISSPGMVPDQGPSHRDPAPSHRDL